MMVNPEKGILLANDICECITDPLNNLYNREVAVKEAFNLLTVPTKMSTGFARISNQPPLHS